MSWGNRYISFKAYRFSRYGTDLPPEVDWGVGAHASRPEVSPEVFGCSAPDSSRQLVVSATHVASEGGSGSGWTTKSIPEEGMDQLWIERHVDPWIEAAVQGEQPEEPLQAFHYREKTKKETLSRMRLFF